MELYASSLRLAGSEAMLALGAMVMLLIGVYRGDRATAALSWLGVAIYVVAGLLLLDSPERITGFDGMFISDSFGVFLKFVTYAAAAAASIVALPWLSRTRVTRFEYPVLLMLSVLGLSIMLSSNDMMTLYIGLELSALASYVLAAYARSDARSTEAGLKYFVLGALSSGILLFGISLVYGFAGSTSFAALADIIQGEEARSVGVIVGLVFVLAGLAFKVSAVPFHMWTPDVYEGAPTAVATFFAAAQKVAAMGLLVRVTMQAFGGAAEEWRQIIAFIAIASMLLGAVGAIGQGNIKRLLAYSSIANVGFALIGLAAASQPGIAGVLFYMAVYAAMTLGSFVVVLGLRDEAGYPIETIASLAGLSRTRPSLAAAMAVFMFSLAGVPPMLGFWPKLSVFNAAIDAHMYVLAVIGVLASVISAYYYLRIVKVMYFDEPSALRFAPAEGRVSGGIIAATALFCSPLGMLLISPILGWAQAAARSLF